MSLTAFLLVAVAGLLAGVINSIAGAGFADHLTRRWAAGLPPVRANGRNAIGLVPARLSGRFGDTGRNCAVTCASWRCWRSPSAIGGTIGAVLLLQLPPRVFEVVVPLLVASASVLVLVQPWIAHHLAVRAHNLRAALASLLVVGVYAG